MKQRNPLAVFFFSTITLGIYGLVWLVKTKKEMNALGANIPTAWLLIIPIVSLYWLWKYSEGVEKATGGKTAGPLAFLVLFLLGSIGMAIVQAGFNGVSSAPAAAEQPAPAVPVATPVVTTTPTMPAPTVPSAPAPVATTPVAPVAPVTPPSNPTDGVQPPQPPVV